MISFKGFLVGLFTSNEQTADTEAAREAGRRDAREMIGAYAEAFREEASTILSGTRQQVLYLEPEDVRELPVSTRDEYASRSRAELMTDARNRGLETNRSMTKDDLVDLLCR